MKKKIQFSLVYRDMWQSSGKFQPRKDQLERIAPVIIEMGCFSRVETNGGAFEQVNLLAGNNPNEAVRAFCKPFNEVGIKTHMLDRGLNALRMYPVPDDVRQLMYKVKHAQGVDIPRIFCGLNDERNIIPSIKWAKEAGMTPQATLCITNSPVHTVEYYAHKADLFVEAGAPEICLKDMAGIGLPSFLGELVRTIKERHPEVIIEYHGHSGPGLSMASILEVCENGADIIDTAIEPLAWGKVHPDIISVQAMLKRKGFDVPEVNMNAYMHARSLTQEFIDDWLGYFINPANKHMSSLLLGCGLPGGMMGSMMADLGGIQGAINNNNKKAGKPELSNDDMLVALFQEVEYVWPKVGYPPLVTPFSQYVKNIALMNLFTMSQGKGRFVMMDDSMWGMILGKSGKVPGPIAPELIELAKKQGREFVTADPHTLYPNALDDFRAEMDKNGWDYGQDDEELFELAMHPEQYRNYKSGQAKKNFEADLAKAKAAKAPKAAAATAPSVATTAATAPSATTTGATAPSAKPAEKKAEPAPAPSPVSCDMSQDNTPIENPVQASKIQKLIELREKARIGGGEKAIDKQHARGKYTARERIDMLLDEGSFEEYDMFKLHRCTNFGMEKKQFLGDGVVVGHGTIQGRLVYVFAQDFTVNGGSLSKTMSEKICKVMDMAMKMGAPCIGINDSGGARIQEGIDALAGYSEIFQRNIEASGVIPQISGIFGPCAGGAVYSPALTDFTLMMEGTSYMFLTGPAVVKSVTGENVDAEHLGGASVHSTKSGVTHFTAKTEEEAIAMIQKLISYIPQNNLEETPRVECNDPVNRADDLLNEIIPENPNQAYDMYKVIAAVVDNGEFFEVQPKYAKNIIVGFARFNGQSVGIVANQPMAYAGVLDCNASRKGARFVRFCDCFNIPIVTLVDVPGFLPGTGQEYNAVILNGAKLLYAYGEATVPKITVTLRKSYGGSHIVMGCKQLKADLNYAWPSAEIAVMGASGAVAVLQAKALKACKEEGGDVAALKAEKEKEYTDLFQNPYQAAKYGYIDDVIEPRNTRFRICRGLAMLETKRETRPAKKHGNMPT